ncbi:dTMP kinase [Trichococcus pasteurii]|uniref:Thymidylate kinase n=1 Tax=Trichococcus pasteurii TaxID=43064 RepID=A0A1W1IH63_9LACT|nr:dTMP kinase [Trichococcus pasteurii]SFE89493.1 dTMP kinase [Trichococcus pasteurii]SLM52306.1 thymidylate kinase [Trichococcus pasteurii]SSB93187.1 thymidylate kinase [Trichococcus pasteurii]
MRGIFITIEGPDGSGKTTALQQVVPRLQQEMNRKVVATREPGGSPIAEKIRSLILDPLHTDMDSRTEALLYAASRRQHLIEKVLPVLESGDVIFCDRFVDSSIAYQGYARGIGEEGIREINEFATEGIEPDVTLYIDVPAEVGIQRIHANLDEREYNRLDQEKLAFHEKVRAGYQQLAKANPERIVVVDGTMSREAVAEACYHIIKNRYPSYF